MRLLNASRRTLISVSEAELPQYPYCILSHCWSDDPDDEILYNDIAYGDAQTWTKKLGYAKLDGACKLAARWDCSWIWIDTCCIDKSSSAELSESLNSMFYWYSQAKVCIAYLRDVPAENSFDNSRWWSRGWTLQELIAPKLVCFYDGRFEYLGNKREHYRLVSRITGIEISYIITHHSFKQAPIATRFSWASRRETSRKEDEAYCLLGLMQVNMTANYGEREGAFLRLQKEVMKKSYDETLFAWIDDTASSDTPMGLLAPSLRCFKDSGNVERLDVPQVDGKPYRWTQKGVEFTRRHGKEYWWDFSTRQKSTTVLPIYCTKGWYGLLIHLCRVNGQHHRIKGNDWRLSLIKNYDIYHFMAGGYHARKETFCVPQPQPHTMLDKSDIVRAQEEPKAEMGATVLALGGMVLASSVGYLFRNRRQKKQAVARQMSERSRSFDGHHRDDLLELSASSREEDYRGDRRRSQLLEPSASGSRSHIRRALSGISFRRNSSRSSRGSINEGSRSGRRSQSRSRSRPR